MKLEHVSLKVGDITREAVDAVVNAANPAMLGGGGVDGAIHRAAGPALLEACREVPATTGGVRCPTGEARITGAGKLPARFVIHTVGPRYGIDPEPDRLLHSAYDNSFRLARAHHCQSVALPAVSCGVYGYPLDEAARVALGAAAPHPQLAICFCLFSDEVHSVWQEIYRELSD